MKYLKRKKNRKYRSNRCSQKWKDLQKLYKKEISRAKKDYYSNMIEDLKTSNPFQVLK